MLWSETQAVTLDAGGRYEAILSTTVPLPSAFSRLERPTYLMTRTLNVKLLVAWSIDLAKWQNWAVT